MADELESAEDDQPTSHVPDVWRLMPPGISLHAWQRECLPLWLDRARGTVKVATGGGKTLFALAAIEELHNRQQPDLKVAIIVPTIPLMLQWADELRKSNLPESAIGLMGGGHHPAPLEGRGILVCVLSSARDRLPELMEQARWSNRLLLVVDECYRANAEQARRIFESKPALFVAVGLQSMNEPKLTFRDEYDVVHYGRGGLGWYVLSCEGISHVRNDRIHRAEFEKPPTCMWCVAKESRA